jgi:hypothetical protein
MNILLEALNNLNNKIHILNDYNKIDLTISEEDRQTRSFYLLFLFEKIDAFINEINTNINSGITHLTVGQRNLYFKKYDLDKNDILYIKINMRRIKNRNYQQKSRDRIKINN